jgi:Asp-tRNA(Asn)/Glu-tRNA(Gln) amidotransferase A subunit family amidase
MSDAALNDPDRQRPRGARWKVALVTSSLRVWDQAKPYARDAIQGFADALARHGVDVEETKVPDVLNTAHAIHETIYDKTLAYYFQQEYENPHLVSEILKQMIAHGQRVAPAEYHAALEAQRRVARAMDEWFADWDIILALSTAGEAPLFGHDDIPDSCLIWTLCGLPTINLPVFAAPGGLPFGAQVVARRYNDPLLLKFVEFLHERGLIRNAEPPAATATAGGSRPTKG